MKFRWRYVLLPIVLFIVSLITVAFFYRLLPAEVAYRFSTDGSPSGLLSRGMIVLWAVVPQFLLFLLAPTFSGGLLCLR